MTQRGLSRTACPKSEAGCSYGDRNGFESLRRDRQAIVFQTDNVALYRLTDILYRFLACPPLADTTWKTGAFRRTRECARFEQEYSSGGCYFRSLTYSNESTRRLPSADAAFSSWRRLGQCFGSSSLCAEGHEVSRALATSDTGRLPRTMRIRIAA